jgi:hypothetical protein
MREKNLQDNKEKINQGSYNQEDTSASMGIPVRKYYGDDREAIQFCVYCGGSTESFDHVPSKVFLDKPYPLNLQWVPACKECNKGFSLDEEYVACLVECLKTGSFKSEDVEREKIEKILKRKPLLAERIYRACKETLNGKVFSKEMDRIEKIILKLARGHAAFELNRPILGKPQSIGIFPLSTIPSSTRKAFETPPNIDLLPEVGTRAFQRLIESGLEHYFWTIVQPGRYRYLTANGDGVLVRMVIIEYLACEVMWKEGML